MGTIYICSVKREVSILLASSNEHNEYTEDIIPRAFQHSMVTNINVCMGYALYISLMSVVLPLFSVSFQSSSLSGDHTLRLTGYTLSVTPASGIVPVVCVNGVVVHPVTVICLCFVLFVRLCP